MAPPPSPPAPLCTASGTDGVVGNGREGGRAGVKEGGAVAAFAFSATRSPSALPPIGGFVDVAPEATACRSSSSLCSAASLEAEEETEETEEEDSHAPDWQYESYQGVLQSLSVLQLSGSPGTWQNPFALQ